MEMCLCIFSLSGLCLMGCMPSVCQCEEKESVTSVCLWRWVFLFIFDRAQELPASATSSCYYYYYFYLKQKDNTLLIFILPSAVQAFIPAPAAVKTPLTIINDLTCKLIESSPKAST